MGEFLAQASWGFVLVLMAGVLLTGISKSGFAGNLGVVTVPLLSLVMPLEQAAVLMLPVLIAMDIKVVHYYYAAINRAVLWAVIPPACVGIALGALAMGNLSTGLLQAGLGVVCMVFALWHTLNQWFGRLPGAAALWGTVAGFTSTLIHAGGPPMNVYFAGQQLPKLQWLATSGCFFALINWVKVVPYTSLGLWQWGTFWLSLLVLPVAWLGVWLGHVIQRRFDDQKFVTLSRALVFLSGVVLLYKAWEAH